MSHFSPDALPAIKLISSTVTSKGQVTIPKEIRDYLKLDVGCKVDFVINENGGVRLVPLTVPVTALSGILHRRSVAFRQEG